MRNLRAKLAVGLLVLALLITAAPTNADEVLLFTYFRHNGQDGVHLATSTNGLNFVALRLARAGTLTVPNNISGNGSVTVAAPVSSDRVMLSGNNSFTGPISVSSGTLVVTDDTQLGTGPKNVTASGNTATLAVSGVIDNYVFNNVTVNFQSAGGGTLTVIGNGNDYLNWMLNGGLTVQTAGGARSVFSATSGYGLNLNGNNIAFNVARGTHPRADLFVSAPLTSSGSVTKQGSGILRLTASHTYTGSTTIGNGTLLVNGSLAGGAVTVAGGTLGGTGTLGGAVTVQSGAKLAPGASLGTLTISNTLTLAAGSRTEVEINAATGTNDVVTGLTTVDYGGTLVVSNLAGFVTNGQSFKLFSVASSSGNFNRITPAPGFGLAWSFQPTSGTLTATSAPNQLQLIPPDAVWKYFDRTNDLGAAWRSNSFSDLTWSSGLAQLGFGDGDESTVIASNQQITTYFRRSFLATPASFTNLELRLLRDDGGIVYLNGVEVFRSNLTNGPVNFLTLASNALASDETTNFYTTTVNPALLVSGENLVAVEVHQSSVTSSDIGFDFELTAAALLAVAPRLALGTQPSTLHFTWPSDASYFSLYSTTNFIQPVAWMPVSNAAILSNNQWHVILPAATSGQRFYRLQSP